MKLADAIPGAIVVNRGRDRNGPPRRVVQVREATKQEWHAMPGRKYVEAVDPNGQVGLFTPNQLVPVEPERWDGWIERERAKKAAAQAEAERLAAIPDDELPELLRATRAQADELWEQVTRLRDTWQDLSQEATKLSRELNRRRPVAVRGARR